MFSMKQYLPRIKNYFRRNPETLFIVVFQVLLLICAVLLISGNSFWAEGAAVVAYFSLVIGVVLQLISFLRYRESESEENER
jgi:heme/copper-type cytochrome/quinol oxidase subunit 4